MRRPRRSSRCYEGIFQILTARSILALEAASVSIALWSSARALTPSKIKATVKGLSSGKFALDHFLFSRRFAKSFVC